MSAALKFEAEEKTVAVLPTAVTELELTENISHIELEAEAISIDNEADYRQAAEFGRTLKQMSAKVVDFFKPMKESANRTHRELCAREKILLGPLQRAEVTLKATMGDYITRKEDARKTAEEDARRAAQEEAARKLADAIIAEEAGDYAAAAACMADAQISETMGNHMIVSFDKPKAEGVSQSKDWELVSIDMESVPVLFAGIVIRPVDDKAVMRMIRASKGQIAIPGIMYRETVKTSIRG